MHTPPHMANDAAIFFFVIIVLGLVGWAAYRVGKNKWKR